MDDAGSDPIFDFLDIKPEVILYTYILIYLYTYIPIYILLLPIHIFDFLDIKPEVNSSILSNQPLYYATNTMLLILC
jgi:hypothetical protein